MSIMASQFRDAMKWKSQNSNSGGGGGSDALSTLLGLGGKGGQKGGGNSDRPFVLRRMSYEIDACGDIRKDRSLEWNNDDNAEFVTLLTPYFGLQRSCFQQKVAPIFVSCSHNYVQSLRNARALQRVLTASMSQRQCSDLVSLIETFMVQEKINFLSVTELMEAEKAAAAAKVKDDVDSEEEWQNGHRDLRRRQGRGQRNGAGKGQQRRDAGGGKGQHRREVDGHGQRQPFDGDMTGFRAGWERDDRPDPWQNADPWSQGADWNRGHEDWRDWQGDEDENRHEPTFTREQKAERFEMDGDDDMGWEAQRQTGAAHQPFRGRQQSPGNAARRSRSAGPSLQSPGAPIAEPPSGNPAPKSRARRESDGASPRNIFPPMGHG